MSKYAEIIRQWMIDEGVPADGVCRRLGIFLEGYDGDEDVAAYLLSDSPEISVNIDMVAKLVSDLLSTLAADPLSVGTVLRAGDPAPPDGTAILFNSTSGRVCYWRWRPNPAGFSWADWATRYGPIVVAPDYDKLVGEG